MAVSRSSTLAPSRGSAGRRPSGHGPVPVVGAVAHRTTVRSAGSPGVTAVRAAGGSSSRRAATRGSRYGAGARSPRRRRPRAGRVRTRRRSRRGAAPPDRRAGAPGPGGRGGRCAGGAAAPGVRQGGPGEPGAQRARPGPAASARASSGCARMRWACSRSHRYRSSGVGARRRVVRSTRGVRGAAPAGRGCGTGRSAAGQDGRGTGDGALVAPAWGRRRDHPVGEPPSPSRCDGTGVVVGRRGDLRIFTCPADHRHAFPADLHRLSRRRPGCGSRPGSRGGSGGGPRRRRPR